MTASDNSEGMTMLKVVCVVDKDRTALDRLARGVAPYHDNLDYSVVAVHPKRPDPEQLEAFETAARDADIIDWQYFKTAVMLREKYPWLSEKKHILTHNNPYSYKEDRWEWADINVGNNKSIVEGLEAQGSPKIEYIPITTDPLFWQYKREWKPGKRAIMVANRIEGKKGILPAAIACGDAGLRMTLVGAVSDRAYLYDILQTGCVDFYEQVSDEELRNLYHQSTIHICNSVDNFESGTMPILEAMQCGVPVLTRKVGHVPDLYNGDNLWLYEGDPEDNILIELELKRMLLDTKKLDSQRQSAWNTAKNHNFERRAYEYQKLYRKVLSDKAPVSVVVPIHSNADVIRACFNSIASQDYPNIEVIAVNDNEDSEGYYQNGLIEDFSKTVSFPIRYIHSAQNDYGLARGRNRGIIEATGEIIVFCDQRQIMEPNAISELVNQLVPRTWVYGNKGPGKKDFVENFSAIYKDDIVRAGMFNERMNKYGGITQEVRSRTRMQGIRHVYVESAKATPMGKSSNKNTKKMEIIEMKNKLWKMGL
jgi:glycosyltransferase involved in cell wall biosynthesis